jgi:uncharacterized membrane protein
MDPIILAIISMLLTGSSDFLYRRARLEGAPSEFFLFFQAIIFNTASLCYVVVQGTLHLTIPTIIFGISCGLLAYFSVLLFLKSLGHGHASTNAPIFRLSFIITALFAISFLNEILTMGKLLAIGLATFSIIALSGGLKKGNLSYKMLLPLMLATFLYGIFGFLYKVAILTGSTPTGILVIQGATFIPCSLIFAFKSRTIGRSRSVMTYAPICGVLLVSSFLLLLESLKYGEVSVSFSIVQLSFVLTSFLAVLFLKEKFRTLNFVGISAAILAVISFAYI